MLARLGAHTFKLAFGHLYAPNDPETFIRDSHHAQTDPEIIQSGTHQIWRALSENGTAVVFSVAGPISLPFTNAAPDTLDLERLSIDGRFQLRGPGARFIITFFVGPEILEIQSSIPRFTAKFTALKNFINGNDFVKMGSIFSPLSLTET